MLTKCHHYKYKYKYKIPVLTVYIVCIYHVVYLAFSSWLLNPGWAPMCYCMTVPTWYDPVLYRKREKKTNQCIYLKNFELSILIFTDMASNLKLVIYLLVLFLICASNASSRKMVGIYELKKGDFSVKVTNWGATIISVVLPDSKGVCLSSFTCKRFNQCFVFQVIYALFLQGIWLMLFLDTIQLLNML